MRMATRTIFGSKALVVGTVGRSYMEACPRCGIERAARRDRPEGTVCRDCKSILIREADLEESLAKMTPAQLKAWLEEDS